MGLRADQQHELLAGRVQQMVTDVATRLRPASGLSQADAAALFNANQSELIEAARAHAELLQWEAFTDAVNSIEHDGTKHVLTWLRDLFGLGADREAPGLVPDPRAAVVAAGRGAVSSYIDRLCLRLRPHAQDLVDAFGYAPERLRALIASGAEQSRQDEARTYYRELAASGEAPISEKVANKK